MHSFQHFYDLIEDTFYDFDLDYLGRELLHQRRAPHESVINFWQCFSDLQFQALKSQMKFAYLWDRFEYCLKKSARPKRKLDINPHLTFFIDGTVQSHVGVGIVLTNYLPPSHLATPPLPNDVENHAHKLIHPSLSPNITPLDFHADLVVSSSSSHMHSFLQPLSLHSGVPPDDSFLCSSILDSTLIVNKEQPTDVVSVAQQKIRYHS